jgi:hypothetical protein
LPTSHDDFVGLVVSVDFHALVFFCFFGFISLTSVVSLSCRPLFGILLGTLVTLLLSMISVGLNPFTGVDETIESLNEFKLKRV